VKVDEDLKLYLDAKFAEVHGEFASAHGEFAAVRSEIAAVRVDLRADIEKSETNLLRAFHGWARSMEIRVRGISAVSTGFEERLAMAEERISEVERRQAS